MMAAIAGFPEGRSAYPVTIRIEEVTGFAYGEYAWIYAIKFYDGGTLVHTLSAQQIANVTGWYYDAAHWTGAPTAMVPYGESVWTIPTGVTVQTTWDTVAVEWGGGMGNAPGSGYTAVRDNTVERNRLSWSNRASNQAYASRNIDVVNLF